MPHVRHVLLLCDARDRGLRSPADSAPTARPPASRRRCSRGASTRRSLDDGAAAVKQRGLPAPAAPTTARRCSSALEASALRRSARRPRSSSRRTAPDAAKTANGGAASRARRPGGGVHDDGRARSSPASTAPAPAALAAVTRSGAASDLRAAAKELKRERLRAGALGAQAAAARPSLRAQERRGARRARAAAGPGRAGRSRNGDDREGVVKLVAGGQADERSTSRRKNDRRRSSGIPDGNFEVYFASGSLLGRQAQHLQPQLRLHRVRRQDEVHVRRRAATRSFTITLNAVAGRQRAEPARSIRATSRAD